MSMLPFKSARPVLLALLLTGAPGLLPASAQSPAPTQTLVIGYPDGGVPSGKVGSPLYRGLVYVTVFATSPELVRQYGTAPVVSAELTPRQRDVRTLPLGTYEVHFAVRNGSEVKTFILRNVILRADRGSSLTVEVNLDAATTIVGGDLTAEQMAALIRALQARLSALEQRVSALTPK
ncbi:hypothetical protein MF271_12760 [Deinococcus sp. KNUC1210]|uniref:hypothetical protein n=1 Tax=Deinococcus sp. KNUC1210 TaxID=2917691 RepID=UPI001EF0CEFA|nr:hypothetical protein [Deinococcus sp. KNUC1210]ULH14845.1 hypothetical protein MF271_12760 [Deinococcus sp. KNUC1210]